MASTSVIKIHAQISTIAFQNAADQLTFRLKFGGQSPNSESTIGSFVIANNSGGTINSSGMIDMYIQNAGSVTAQEGGFVGIFTSNSGGFTNTDSTRAQMIAVGSGTEDTTTDRYVTLTAQYNVSNGSNNINLGSYYAELIK